MDEHFGHHWGLEIPFGKIVGAVRLIDCIPTDHMPDGHSETDDYVCGDFSSGRYAWRRGLYRLFAEPVPFRGAQGFFQVPDDLVFNQMREGP